MQPAPARDRHATSIRVATLLAILLAIFAAPAARATDPSFGQVLPPGARRGQETEVRVLGTRLGDAQEILFTRSGIEVVEILEVKDNEVRAKIRVAPDAPLGNRSMYVRTLTGVTGVNLFTVGAMNEIEEDEANNDDVEKAPKIELNTTIQGLVEGEDVDYASFEVAAGQRVNFEVEAFRLGRTVFDPVLVLFDSKGIEIAAADDSPLMQWDCSLSHEFAEAGTYVIAVRETAFGGNGSCRYRLHVGSYPRPTGVFPAGGKPGEAVKVRWIGDPRIPETDLTPDPAHGEWGVFAELDGVPAPSSVPFRVNALDNYFDAEPNNDHASATQVAVPCAINGTIDVAKDYDWYKFDAKKDQTFEFGLYARRVGSPLDSVMGIQKFQGGGLAGDDDAARPDSYFRYTIPEDGTYVVYVHDQLMRGGSEFVYRMEIAPVQPSVNLVLYVPGAKDVQNVVAPVGNRIAKMLSVRRADLGGDMKVWGEALPAGLSIQVDPVPNGIGDVPILFEADATTTASGALADLRVKPTDENVAVEGRLSQGIEIVRIENNVPVVTYRQDRLPIVVTKPAPFHLDLIEPKVPIVRSGSMNLVVKVTRAEGYAEPVGVRLLWNPPGVSSSTTTIAADQTTGTLQLTANGGAGLGDWKIVAIGGATVEGAGLEVSSALTKLTVSEPWVQLAYDKVRTDQGAPVEMPTKIVVATEFQGAAKMELLALPPNVGAPALEFTKEVPEVKFALAVAAEAPVGKFNPFARVTIWDQGEPIVHDIGGAELRIDKPLPPPTPPPPPEPGKTPEPTPKPGGPVRGERKPATGIAPFVREGQQ